MPGAAAGRRPPWVLGQAAVLVGGACVALHLAGAVVPDQRGWPARVLLAGMAAACLPCLRALWRGPSRRVWAGTGAMYAAMLAVHLLTTGGRGGMRHGDAGLTWTELGMWAFVVLASAQLLLVAVALVPAVPAGRRRRPPGGARDAVPAPGGFDLRDAAGGCRMLSGGVPAGTVGRPRRHERYPLL